jgi:hypothetical protein
MPELVLAALSERSTPADIMSRTVEDVQISPSALLLTRRKVRRYRDVTVVVDFDLARADAGAISMPIRGLVAHLHAASTPWEGHRRR